MTERNTFYWAQWFDGNVWLLEDGIDFPHGKRHYVSKKGYEWAKRRGWIVKMRRAPKGGLMVQRILDSAPDSSDEV